MAASMTRPRWTGSTHFRLSPSGHPFPMQRRFVFWGLVSATLAGLWLQTFLSAFSFLVLFLVLAALWRGDEPPVLAFCVFYQWLFVVTGYFDLQWSGVYPNLPLLGDLEGAVFLSLLGFLCLAAGIRLGIHLCRGAAPLTRVEPGQWAEFRYDVRLLFWIVISLYSINYFVEITPMTILFEAAQILYRVLEFRAILFLLLLLTILKQREGYRYGLIAFVYIWIPNLPR